jgi:hypothetical protein
MATEEVAYSKLNYRKITRWLRQDIRVSRCLKP